MRCNNIAGTRAQDDKMSAFTQCQAQDIPHFTLINADFELLIFCPCQLYSLITSFHIGVLNKIGIVNYLSCF